MFHRLTIICFIIILVEIVPLSSRSSSSRSRSTSRSSSRSSSSSVGAIIGYTILTVVSTIVLMCTIYCICLNCRNKSKENSKSKKKPDGLIARINLNNIFESGHWESRYYQNENWHGPFQQEINFNIKQTTLNGNGSDDIGQFNLTGHISIELKKIHMIKKYISDNENPIDNIGHEVKINLTWNDSKHAFIGKWFVQTENYKGEGEYELFKTQISIQNKEQYI